MHTSPLPSSNCLKPTSRITFPQLKNLMNPHGRFCLFTLWNSKSISVQHDHALIILVLALLVLQKSVCGGRSAVVTWKTRTLNGKKFRNRQRKNKEATQEAIQMSPQMNPNDTNGKAKDANSLPPASSDSIVNGPSNDSSNHHIANGGRRRNEHLKLTLL